MATVDVISPTLTVGVTGSQTYGGTPGFADTLPTAPAGVTIGGSLSGCHTSLTSTAPAGFHTGTISGCGGLTLSGPNAAYYSLAYADNGFSVAAASLAVTVTGAPTLALVIGSAADAATYVSGSGTMRSGVGASMPSRVRAMISTRSGVL